MRTGLLLAAVMMAAGLLIWPCSGQVKAAEQPACVMTLDQVIATLTQDGTEFTILPDEELANFLRRLAFLRESPRSKEVRIVDPNAKPKTLAMGTESANPHGSVNPLQPRDAKARAFEDGEQPSGGAKPKPKGKVK